MNRDGTSNVIGGWVHLAPEGRQVYSRTIRPSFQAPRGATGVICLNCGLKGLGLLTEPPPGQHLKLDIEASPDLLRIPINRKKPLSLWAVEPSPDVRLHRKRFMSTLDCLAITFQRFF